MKCVIEGNSVKVFGKALHALSRVGDELWLDPLEKGLALRTVNMAHSAYACFLFSPLFFQQYKSVAELPQNRGNLKCKLTMKECEPLQAVFLAHLCLNVLKAQARLLGDIIMHFPIHQEEVTLTLSPMRVNWKNFFEEEKELMKAMHTEMSLNPEEFDYFQVGVDSDITFCLKELRGFLSFAESYCLPMAIHFGSPGKPVCFSVEDMVLEASVVLATLADPESRTPSQNPGPQEEARIPIVLRCDGEMDSHDPTASQPPGRADMTPQPGSVEERIASSQGSPVFSGLARMRDLLQLHKVCSLSNRGVVSSRAEQKFEEPACATPMPWKFRSLLFGAVSGLQADGGVSSPPSLVCCSDTEEEAGEKNQDCHRTERSDLRCFIEACTSREKGWCTHCES
ncbi:hypothetical protein AGOR_G00052640 [Albula goreensis]|uniref:Cell cycle checkpoint control protein RAD9A n=1 Tax=Albula goreensis TaxID=1534307 RepID=A0A8T3DXZ5_9TELE|nr:hypothetical protein AGOR_G00052640 [Albula goreensis]